VADRTGAALKRRSALVATWVALPLLGAIWVLSRYRHTWYFYDEWSLVREVADCRGAVKCATTSFNGHLWILNHVVYRIQTTWFGLNGHRFVYGLFILSLVALHLSIAAVLRALRLSAPLCVAAGGLVTYLGVGSQSMLFEIQVATNAASAASFAAAAIAMSRPASRASIASVSALCIFAFASDSATALVALVFIAVVAWTRWSPAAVVAALSAPVVLHLVWLRFGDPGPTFGAPLHDQLVLVGQLLLRGAGGLVGGEAIAGAVVLAVAGTCLAAGLLRRRLDRATILTVVAGAGTAIVAAAFVAQRRTAVVGDDFVAFNRYVQTESLFLVLAVVPALAGVAASRWRNQLQLVLTGAVVAGFLVGLSPLLEYRDTFETYNETVHASALQGVALLDHGCPPGTAVDLDAAPAADTSPQLTMRLLARARAEGWLRPSTADVSPEVIARVCR
jgi:hypothetical protein